MILRKTCIKSFITEFVQQLFSKEGFEICLHPLNHLMKEIEQKSKKQRELLVQKETVCVSRFIQTS